MDSLKENLIITLLEKYEEDFLTRRMKNKQLQHKDFIFNGIAYYVEKEHYLTICSIIDCIKGVEN